MEEKTQARTLKNLILRVVAKPHFCKQERNTGNRKGQEGTKWGKKGNQLEGGREGGKEESTEEDSGRKQRQAT